MTAIPPSFRRRSPRLRRSSLPHRTPPLLLPGVVGALLLASVALAAWPAARQMPSGQSQATGAAPLSKAFRGKLPITELTEEEAVLHALGRLGYGPRPGDMERVKRMGLEKWIDQQLHPASIDDSALDARLARFKTLRMSSKQLLDAYPRPDLLARKQGITAEQAKAQSQQRALDARQAIAAAGFAARAQVELANIQGPQRMVVELSMARLDRAIYGNRQLEAVLTDFWFNHFNVYANKGAVKWMLTSYERDVIRPHAMGKFHDLLLATAQSPAMLFYLDNWLSVDPVAWERAKREAAARRQRLGLPEPQKKQPERGLNENYGREVMELHTVGVDGGYTQKDVIQMARCLSGWSIRTPLRDPQFYFEDRFHADGPKTVLGRTFNYGGMKDGEEALKMLARQPATAQFISTELAERFVSDHPPPALVARMARTFQSSDGDTRAVLKTMIYSPEFWSRAAYRAKVKTPFELVASTARALGAEIDPPIEVNSWVTRMGQPQYNCQPPTGYSEQSAIWVNTGALLNRLNFALAFATNHVSGAQSNLDALFGPDAAADPNLVLSRALDSFLGGEVAPSTREVLEQRLNDPQILQARYDDPVKHVNMGLIAGLVLGSPEFQRR